MIDKKAFEIISRFRFKKYFSKPLDCRDFISLSSNAVRLFEGRVSIPATLSMGLTLPPRSTGILEKPSRSKDSVGASGSPLTKSIWWSGETVGQKGKVNTQKDENSQYYFSLRRFFGIFFAHAGWAELEFFRKKRTKWKLNCQRRPIETRTHAM